MLTPILYFYNGDSSQAAAVGNCHLCLAGRENPLG
jgi:hypothetical protein